MVKASSIALFHNRLFRRQFRLVGDAEGRRFIRNAIIGGSSSGTAGAAGAGELLLVPSFKESKMNRPAIKIASSNMIFLFMLLCW